MKTETIRRIISVILLTALVLVFSLTTDSFMTAANITSLLRECSVIGILSVGVTFVIITGGNNLSSGAMLGTVSMIIAQLYHSSPLSLIAIWAIAFCAALLLGFLNGYAVSILMIPDFVATLSVQMICQGLTYILAIRSSTGAIVNESIRNATILSLGEKFMGTGIYKVTIAFFLLAIIGQIFLKKTKLGTYFYAIGSNRKSAEYSGISFVKIKMLAFILSAVCSFIGALFLMGRNGTTDVTSGVSLSFQAISAAVIGGASFAGGRGDMLGTVLGVLIMQVLKNGLLKYGIAPQWQVILSGVVIVSMIVFDAFYSEYMQKRTTRRSAVEHSKKKAVTANE